MDQGRHKASDGTIKIIAVIATPTNQEVRLLTLRYLHRCWYGVVYIYSVIYEGVSVAWEPVIGALDASADAPEYNPFAPIINSCDIVLWHKGKVY